MSMINSNDTIGNRTRNLPSWSAVPQPTAPPRSLCLYCDTGQVTPYCDTGQVTPYCDTGQVTPYCDTGQVTPYCDAGQVTPYCDTGQVTPYCDTGQVTPYCDAGQVTPYCDAGQVTPYCDTGQVTPYCDAGQVTPYPWQRTDVPVSVFKCIYCPYIRDIFYHFHSPSTLLAVTRNCVLCCFTLWPFYCPQ